MPDRRTRPHYSRTGMVVLACAILCISVQLSSLYPAFERSWGGASGVLTAISPIGATGTIGAIRPPSTFPAPSLSTFGKMKGDQLLGRGQLLGPKFSGRDLNTSSGHRSLLKSGDTKMQSSGAIAKIGNIKLQRNHVDLSDSLYGASAMQMRAGYMDELLLEFGNQERSMPADLVYDRDRRPAFPFISGDGFRSLCKHRCEEKGCAFLPDDVKRGDCIFIATTNLQTLESTSQFIMDFSEMVDKIRNDFVVITHNGDLSSPDGDDWHLNEASDYSAHYSQLLSSPKLRYWFASNCNWKDYPAAKPTKLICIPIGIENRYNIVGKWPGRYFPLMQKRSQVVPKWRLLVAFAAEANKPSRGPALAALTAPWITNALLDRDAWLQAVQEHFFVACPTGHGYDTHRVWEVLLAGGIPVVPTTPLDSMYEHLPVLIVGKWSDVDEAYLEKAYRRILTRTDFQIERMFFPFWKNLILNMSSTRRLSL